MDNSESLRAAEIAGILIVKRVESASARGDDRVVVRALGDGIVVGVFDGAGGLSGGAHAADRLVEAVEALQDSSSLTRSAFWAEWLAAQDERLMRDRDAGEAAGVILFLRGREIVGASVGDCIALLVAEPAVSELTRGQRRKPLIGSGEAEAFAIGPDSLEGRLLIATDGLHKYANRERLLETLRSAELSELPQRLDALVRLRSGALQDDCGFVVLEEKK